MTVLLPDATDESVYGSSVVDQAKLERARDLVRAEREAADAHEEALRARDEACCALFEDARDELSQNELARRIDLNPSTFRSIIKPLTRGRRK